MDGDNEVLYSDGSDGAKAKAKMTRKDVEEWDGGEMELEMGY